MVFVDAARHRLKQRSWVLCIALLLLVISVVVIGNLSRNSGTAGQLIQSAPSRLGEYRKKAADVSSLNRSQRNSPGIPTTHQVPPVAPLTLPFLTVQTAAGIYTGPGSIQQHKNFEHDIGKIVPYATDYIDYKGGWQKDFVDSKAWLAEPWSEWANEAVNRRLIIGVPMLQNENSGQFEEGSEGQFDSYFRDFGTQLVEGGMSDTIIRLGYEANCDTIGPWQATDNPRGYILMFRHVVSVMRAIPNSRFSFDWTVCNGFQSGKELTSFADFYPGDDVVDIFGMDIYDVKWMDPTATPEQRWAYLLGRPLGINELISFAASHGKRLSYPEWGLYKPGDHFAGGGDDPYFIGQMAELMNRTNPVYQSYFDLDWGGGSLNDFKLGKAAYTQIFGAQ